MSIVITPIERCDITRIVCAVCGEKVKGIGLLPDSEIRGLTFRCRKCGAYEKVTADWNPEKQNT